MKNNLKSLFDKNFHAIVQHCISGYAPLRSAPPIFGAGKALSRQIIPAPNIAYAGTLYEMAKNVIVKT